MSSRRLSRAERRRRLRDERKEPGLPFGDDLDVDDVAAISYSVGRLHGFVEGYIVGKIGISGYLEDAIQEMVNLLPEPHCEDIECYPCRLAMEAVGYFMQADSDEEAYQLGRKTMLDPEPPAQFAERQRATGTPRLRMGSLPEDA